MKIKDSGKHITKLFLLQTVSNILDLSCISIYLYYFNNRFNCNIILRNILSGNSNGLDCCKSLTSI